MRDFAERYGLDWEDFLRNGIDAEILRAIDDHMVKAVIAEAEKDEQK